MNMDAHKSRATIIRILEIYEYPKWPILGNQLNKLQDIHSME